MCLLLLFLVTNVNFLNQKMTLSIGIRNGKEYAPNLNLEYFFTWFGRSYWLKRVVDFSIQNMPQTELVSGS